MVGLDRSRVELESAHAEWRASYKAEVKHLFSIVGASVLRFEHVGSTALSGVPAKPVIDILALVKDLDAASELIDPLETASYEFRPDGKDRLFFTRGPESHRTHYLHVAETGSEYATEMLAFRDYLRKNADAAAAYGDLKRSLAAAFPNDRESYTEHKTEFVERVLDDVLGNR